MGNDASFNAVYSKFENENEIIDFCSCNQLKNCIKNLHSIWIVTFLNNDKSKYDLKKIGL